MVWNETGDRLISTGSDGIIRLWDLGRAETTDVLEAHDDRCWSLIKMKRLLTNEIKRRIRHCDLNMVYRKGISEVVVGNEILHRQIFQRRRGEVVYKRD